jgi:hypothetical protein
VLSDVRYRLAALRVQGEIAAMLSPAAVVPVLEDLASRRSSIAWKTDATQPAPGRLAPQS